MATKKTRSRALEEMHETARGLHKAGVITKRRMQEYDALCNLENTAMKKPPKSSPVLA
ncbi:hypothetical protein [Desulfurivibrio dismutans]|uniref:hypothetical protein n=1 Tax=Desulfurivibrio dismutans TaxID=1398908 RepID=UPI0023DAFEBF|nr:hypothetical protein [Desulfurivibrio alkaliphilus]MDF1614361.1 hypothetical protein [Desulfurivibrio alkaliphilus]